VHGHAEMMDTAGVHAPVMLLSRCGPGARGG
jgi:hypothetical protein